MAILLPACLQVAYKSMAFNYEPTNSSAGASRLDSFLIARKCGKTSTDINDASALPVGLDCGLLTLLNKKAQFANRLQKTRSKFALAT
jgi:hypothetical protein